MKKSLLYVVAAIVTVCLAVALVTMPPQRFGYRDDGSGERCEDNVSTTKYSPALLTYFVFSHPIGDKKLNVGTCPYQPYYVKTYALELWILAGIFVWLGYSVTHKGSVTG